MKICHICGKDVENENIRKGSRYFCSNDCESEYWHKKGIGQDAGKHKKR